METDADQIMLLIGAIVAAAATMYSRWKQIPTDLPTLVKIARMFDLSQVVDSTRRLDDPTPPLTSEDPDGL